MRLTPVQRKVVTLIAEGMSKQDVAGKVFTSHRTVGNHISEIKLRLGAKTLAHAVALAIKTGEIA